MRLHTGKTQRGHIPSDSGWPFQRLDRVNQVMEIPYGDVAYVEQNLTQGAKIGIIALMPVTAALVIFWQYLEHSNAH